MKALPSFCGFLQFHSFHSTRTVPKIPPIITTSEHNSFSPQNLFFRFTLFLLYYLSTLWSHSLGSIIMWKGNTPKFLFIITFQLPLLYDEQDDGSPSSCFRFFLFAFLLSLQSWNCSDLFHFFSTYFSNCGKHPAFLHAFEIEMFCEWRE